MMQSPQTGYDSAITVFSPDGRLFQVEYAREAVKRGTTALGIKAKDGAVLLVDKRAATRLVEMESIEKIFQIDDHIGVATSGLVADARVLVDFARVQAQLNKTTYSEPIGIETLAKEICDFKQSYTQSGGVRPFGTSLLITGVEGDETRIFETDPSGALLEYKAAGIGSGRAEIMEILEKKYTEDIDLDNAIVLGLEALANVTEGPLNELNIEIGIIELSTRKFRKLIPSEVKKYVSRVPKVEKGKKK
ncbi:MAG: proteasome endopeptidase complex, archaeal, alpha subunit [Candidatus Methanoperedenaceae archaeon]|nr:MAG: proteasome endopeptidase complex, archaeal, alpha subunit [Candidatus Methanoperedenaceae archaeon]